MTVHKLTPGQYRQRWELSPSYPVVAPNYAKTRSSLAKKFGLDRKRAAGRRRQDEWLLARLERGGDRLHVIVFGDFQTHCDRGRPTIPITPPEPWVTETEVGIMSEALGTIHLHQPTTVSLEGA